MHVSSLSINHTLIFIITTPFVSNYNTLSTNSPSLRKIVNLLNDIKYVNYLYYDSKIIPFFSLSTYFLLINVWKKNN